MSNLATSTPAPLTPVEILPAIHPAHHSQAYPQVLELCQAQAWGQLTEVLTQYRSYLAQELNSGSILCSGAQHEQLVGNILALQSRAGELVNVLQHNTVAIDANNQALGSNTHQLNRLNNNLEAYLAQSQPPQPAQPIYILNEINAYGGEGGRAISHSTSDSQSTAESDGGGGGYGEASQVALGIAIVVVIAAAVGITHSRPQPGPMQTAPPPAQESPVDGAPAQ